MTSVKFLALIAIVSSSVSATDWCNTVGYGKDGNEYCVDPCMEGQYVYSHDGIPTCPCNKDDRLCPYDCIAFDGDSKPSCMYSHHDDWTPCPSGYIFHYWDGTPDCFDHCKTVRYFNKDPVCLQCDDEDIFYDPTLGPLCFDNCMSVAYDANGVPICLHCDIKDVFYDSYGFPSCFDKCKAVAYYLGNPICLPCKMEFVKYKEDGYPICLIDSVSSKSWTSSSTSDSHDVWSKSSWDDHRMYPEYSHSSKVDSHEYVPYSSSSYGDSHKDSMKPSSSSHSYNHKYIPISSSSYEKSYHEPTVSSSSSSSEKKHPMPYSSSSSFKH